MAVSIPNHEIIWTSSELPGTPNGSPVVYTNQYANENYILLTHNSILLKSDNSTVIAGHVTLLHTERGRVSWTDSEWSREDIPKGYGPPGHVSNPLRGKYDGGTKNSNDLVVWASSAMEGRGPLGNTFAFQLPNNFEETTQQTNALETLVLKKVRWSSITRPVFSSDGLNMFFGVTGNELRGWIGDTRYDETADWSANVVTTSDTSVEDAEAGTWKEYEECLDVKRTSRLQCKHKHEVHASIDVTVSCLYILHHLTDIFILTPSFLFF